MEEGEEKRSSAVVRVLMRETHVGRPARHRCEYLAFRRAATRLSPSCCLQFRSITMSAEGLKKDKANAQTARKCRILEILHYTCPAEPDEYGRPRYSCYPIPRIFNVFV